MRWPSKDPDDYTQRGRWDTDPPRWLARLRGIEGPEPAPYLLSVGAGVSGFIVGGVAGEALAGTPLLPALLLGLAARAAAEAGWRVRRRSA